MVQFWRRHSPAPGRRYRAELRNFVAGGRSRGGRPEVAPNAGRARRVGTGIGLRLSCLRALHESGPHPLLPRIRGEPDGGRSRRTLRRDTTAAAGSIRRVREEQARRLNEAFQRLYYSLADKRAAFLARENDSAKLPNVYEFPREFGKLRSLLIPFLVDLCRPSQLRTNPFLRGFFFTGVRPVVVSDLAPAQQVPQEPAAFDAGATRIFGRQQAGMPLMDMPQGSSRKAPQWVFLNHLFSGLILADKPALGIAQSSVKVSFWRRASMGVAAAVAVVLAILWAISFTGNRELVSSSVSAAQMMPAQGLPSTQMASLDSLQQLEQVREKLALLDAYDRTHKPLPLRFGLYSGDAYPRSAAAGLLRFVSPSPARADAGHTNHGVLESAQIE